MTSFNHKKTIASLTINSQEHFYYNIQDAAAQLGEDITKLPFSLKVLLENLLRNKNDKNVTLEHLKSLASWARTKESGQEIAFYPARVLMQDFTGVPAVVDLAAMRDAMKSLGGDANKINPFIPVDLVIDHSVQVDYAGNPTAFAKNVALEMQRNNERYEFLKWGQTAFDNFRVVPPGTGICHQVNLEYLAKVVFSSKIDGKNFLYPDTLVGTDSHTTMVNGLAVLGWGVGGIEAEAAMLKQPLSMLIPEVIGFKLTGALAEGITATDLVLTVTNMLRKKGVVNKFVEFFGPGLNQLSLANRATIANMAPEYGATCGFFPIDQETINYLKLSAREKDLVELVEKYAKAQGMWRDKNSPDPVFSSTLELDLASVEASLAGPKRPQDRISLKEVAKSFDTMLLETKAANKGACKVEHHDFAINHGDVVIAAITSCTNTSNPEVMVGAALLAKNAVLKGLKVKPWVKSSLAPGSQVVSAYLSSGKLQDYLDQLGFNIVGYGCTTCIGNSGPLEKNIENTINNNELVVAAVLSGNRNFEGRVHPLVKANYLASPGLVIAYALVGNVNVDLTKDALGVDNNGKQVFLKDIWPTQKQINDYIQAIITPTMFAEKYKQVFLGDKLWQDIKVQKSLNYAWDTKSTYINNPPYFHGMKKSGTAFSDFSNMKLLAMFGDSITTDHISPAGDIAKSGPAAKYLVSKGVPAEEFNSYGARRGNHEIMMRGTFANIRIKNELVKNKEGGVTIHKPSNEELSIYDAAMRYSHEKVPLLIIAGKEYGTGSSRDWAAKGTYLLGVKAVIAESFERIHRSNLIGMGVLPLVFKNNLTRKDLNLTGDETFHLKGLSDGLKVLMELELTIIKGKTSKIIHLTCRIDTEDEITYLNNGGILHSVVRKLL
jgi:aconitate hydratase